MPRRNRIGRHDDATVAASGLVGATDMATGLPEIRNICFGDAPVERRPILAQNVLTDLLVNGEREAWGIEPSPHARRKKPQWVNKYIPVSNNGDVFVKYTEELDARHLSCSICDLMNKAIVYLTPENVLNLRNALNTILGDSNG